MSIIGKTSRLPSSPRSRIGLSIRSARSDGVSRASEARPGTPIELQPQEGPLIAGWEVLFAFTEYAPPTLRFPALAAHKGSSERGNRYSIACGHCPRWMSAQCPILPDTTKVLHSVAPLRGEPRLHAGRSGQRAAGSFAEGRIQRRMPTHHRPEPSFRRLVQRFQKFG